MNDIAVAKFNARLAIVSGFLSDLAFIMPIWLLYSLHILHFNSTLAVSIFMSIWIGSAILEIPTGALADRLGRKKIFIIGQLLFSLYPLAYAFKFPLVALIIVCLISAVGSALRSGSLLPIVHASYEKAGFVEKAYNNFLSTSMVATFIARALTGIAGAALYAIDPKWPFFAMFAVTFLNFILGFFIRNTAVKEQTTHTNFEHIRQTFGIMRKSQIVVGVLTSFILFNLVAETVWTAYQVLFEADGRAAVTIGMLFSVAAICSAMAAYAVRFAHGRLHPMRLIQLFGLGVLLTVMLLAQPDLTVRLFAIVPMGFVSGITLVTLSATIQKEIANKYHATALSVMNFAEYFTYAVGSLAFGMLFQFFGAGATRKILLGSIIVALSVVTVYVWKHRKISRYTVVPHTNLDNSL